MCTLCFALESSKEWEYDIIGTTHLHTKFDILRAKNCCPYYITLLWCVTKGTTFSYIFLYFRFMMPSPWAFAAFCIMN